MHAENDGVIKHRIREVEAEGILDQGKAAANSTILPAHCIV